MGYYVKKDDNYILIDARSIITVEAMGKELVICLEDEKITIKKSLASFIEADMDNMLQVNRSTILNINRIIKITLCSYPIVELDCGNSVVSVKVTRNYKKQFMEMLKTNNTII